MQLDIFKVVSSKLVGMKLDLDRLICQLMLYLCDLPGISRNKCHPTFCHVSIA